MDSDPPWAKQLEGEMSLGRHVITFRARSPTSSNHLRRGHRYSSSNNNYISDAVGGRNDSSSSPTASCQMIVHVRDADPPRVAHCPRSFTAPSLPASAASAPVSWREPVFHDNVRVSHVMASFLPGHRFGPGVHRVLYTAADAEGNRARCGFTVTVQREEEKGRGEEEIGTFGSNGG